MKSWHGCGFSSGLQGSPGVVSPECTSLPVICGSSGPSPCVMSNSWVTFQTVCSMGARMAFAWLLPLSWASSTAKQFAHLWQFMRNEQWLQHCQPHRESSYVARAPTVCVDAGARACIYARWHCGCRREQVKVLGYLCDCVCHQVLC